MNQERPAFENQVAPGTFPPLEQTPSDAPAPQAALPAPTVPVAAPASMFPPLGETSAFAPPAAPVATALPPAVPVYAAPAPAPAPPVYAAPAPALAAPALAAPAPAAPVYAAPAPAAPVYAEPAPAAPVYAEPAPVFAPPAAAPINFEPAPVYAEPAPVLAAAAPAEAPKRGRTRTKEAAPWSLDDNAAAPASAPPTGPPTGVASAQDFSQFAAPQAAPFPFAEPGPFDGPSFAPPPVHPLALAQAQADSPPVARAPRVFSNPDTDGDLLAALDRVVELNASDLHVTLDSTPMLRIHGELQAVPGAVAWNFEKIHAALHSIISPSQREIFERELELDFAYTLSADARFRVNIYQQRGSMGAAFRLIPSTIKQLDELGVPDSIKRFARLPRGLVLVTGPTGSGKSTTLAAIIDLVNRERSDHIVTVEDPIEFLHTNKRSLVNQREVGEDTHSFANALKHV
ncbi:MAG: type pili twitching motility protein PilT, partial [Microbacteriaceae bacterium]|nr:type pili twitching motility protein PilT [Microbacteriaceae bacterium]